MVVGSAGVILAGVKRDVDKMQVGLFKILLPHLDTCSLIDSYLEKFDGLVFQSGKVIGVDFCIIVVIRSFVGPCPYGNLIHIAVFILRLRGMHGMCKEEEA